MGDASANIESIYDQKLNSLSGIERITLASNSFEAVKDIIIASFPKNDFETNIKKQLFLRLYGNDFNNEQIQNILSHLVKS